MRIASRISSKLKIVRGIALDPERKPASRIARDVATLILDREDPKLYFKRLAYRDGSGDVRDYLTQKDLRKMYGVKRRGEGWMRNFDDKLLFDQLMRPSGLRLPDLLSYTRMGSLVSPSGQVEPLRDQGATRDHLSSLLSGSPNGALFAKPIIAQQGKGAFLLNRDNLNDNSQAFHKAVFNTDYIIQEALQQHEGMSALYPNSINTLRVVVGQEKGGGVRPLTAIVRMGSGGRPVDNVHAGGLFVGVDLATGRLKTYGYRIFSFGGGRFREHPDTGLMFEGHEIPLFDEVLDLAVQAHTRLPNAYVGWDIGVTPTGPVIIEANSAPYVEMMDVAHGGLRNDPTLRAFLRSYGKEFD